MDIDFEVLQGMEMSEDLKPKLYDSLVQHRHYLEESRGSRFISTKEMDYFVAVMQELPGRPVVVIDLETEAKPYDVLKGQIETYEVSPGNKPLVFVRGYNKERLLEVDKDGLLDHGLRDLSQNKSWSIFLQGSGRYDLIGNISGSSSTSPLGGQELI